MVFDFLEKHPFFFNFGICLLLFLTAGIFFGGQELNVSEIAFFILTGIFIFLEKNNTQRIGILFIATLFFLIYILLERNESFLFGAELCTCFLFVWLNKKQQFIYPFGIIFSAFLLHLYYLQNTPIDLRQHDWSGIRLYIHQITQNGINWQNFDPWYMYYLFHQPFHFLIAGYIYDLEIFMWHSTKLASEGLQYLSLFYVTASILFVYAILKELQFTNKLLYSALILFAFNPTLTLFTGFVSDDTPTVFWSVMVIYFAIRWYKEENAKYIVFSALAFGFGVLTKLSVLMLVPALSFLFLYKLFSKDGNQQRILLHLSFFVIIAVPLSLVWIIRNHIFYDMQFYNIPDTSPAGQNFKYLGLLERICDFSMLGIPFLNAPIISDANIFLALIKTELFGEWDFSISHQIVYWPAFILYCLNILIKLFVFIGICIILRIFLSSRFSPILCFFMIIYGTIWGYAFKYALDYPYICSTNFRLFAQLMLPEIIILISAFNTAKKSTALLAVAISYAVLSCFVYTFGI